MEFREVFTSLFTTQTTCYSSGRKHIVGATKSPSNVILDFATENHILGVRMVETPIGTGYDDVMTSSRSLPRDSAQLTCIGYAEWEEEEMEPMDQSITDGAISSLTTVRRIEALALIDDELIQDPEPSQSVNLLRPSEVVIEKDETASAATPTTDGRSQSIRRISSVSSTASMTTASAGTPTTDGRSQSIRRISSVSSTASMTTSTAANPPLSSSSYHRKSQSELSKGSQTTINSETQQSYHTNNTSTSNIETDKTKATLITQKSKARLVLRQDRYAIKRKVLSEVSGEAKDNGDQDQDGNEDDRVYQRQLQTSAFAPLDFRPLCPCVAQWGNQETTNSVATVTRNDDEDKGDSFVGIWLGSADDATLRLYAPSPNDPRQLVSVALPEEHFSVDSPVMAIDFCSVHGPDPGGPSKNNNQSEGPTTHTLAIACQDGTIQLITWKDPSPDTATGNDTKHCLFGEISSEKVIVDGPLVCLKLDYNRFASLRVVVGSLCGYVCQLTFNPKIRKNSSDSSWEGPHMVVQDLFNSSINIEESVLSVDVWENYVAIGTHLGRCLLYATRDSEEYKLVWQAVLPYPVHGIAIVPKTATTVGRLSILSLAVITRRSFHVFKATREDIQWKHKPRWERYSSELAKTRLLKILDEIRSENEVSDLATRKSVHEVVDGLLNTVEHTAMPTTDLENTADVISGTIVHLVDRVEERIASERSNTSSIDSYETALEATPQETIPHTDPPHWEYSSSDEEEASLTLERSTSTNDGAEEDKGVEVASC